MFSKIVFCSSDLSIYLALSDSLCLLVFQCGRTSTLVVSGYLSNYYANALKFHHVEKKVGEQNILGYLSTQGYNEGGGDVRIYTVTPGHPSPCL
jgi:hypothetical protein